MSQTINLICRNDVLHCILFAKILHRTVASCGFNQFIQNSWPRRLASQSFWPSEQSPQNLPGQKNGWPDPAIRTFSEKPDKKKSLLGCRNAILLNWDSWWLLRLQLAGWFGCRYAPRGRTVQIEINSHGGVLALWGYGHRKMSMSILSASCTPSSASYPEIIQSFFNLVSYLCLSLSNCSPQYSCYKKNAVICWGFFLPAVFVRPRVADSIVQANNKDKIRCGLIPPNDLWLLWCQKKARLAKLLKWKNQNRHCSSVKSWTHTKEFSSLLQDAGTPHKCHPWADSRNAVLVHLADSKSAYNPKNFCCKN